MVLVVVDVEAVVTVRGGRYHHLPDAFFDGLLEVELKGEVARPRQRRHGGQRVVRTSQYVFCLWRG